MAWHAPHVQHQAASGSGAVHGQQESTGRLRLRVADACMRQLDALKAHPNVLVLTTSNITEAIDLAFVDRADIKAYIGPPGLKVRVPCRVASTLVMQSCVE